MIAALGSLYQAVVVPDDVEWSVLQPAGAPRRFDAPPDTRAIDALALAAAPFDPRGRNWSAASVELWMAAALAARRRGRTFGAQNGSRHFQSPPKERRQ